MRWMIFLALLAGLGCSHTAVDRIEHTDELHLLVLGDRTGGHRPGVFPKILHYADSLAATAWLSVGDLIEGYSEDPFVLQREWSEIDAIFSDYNTPLYAAPGNHDIANELQKALWLKRYGRTYFSVRFDDVLMLVLDTEDPPVALPEEVIAKQNLLVANMQRDSEKTQAALLARAENSATNRLPGVVAISKAQLQWAKEELESNRDAGWTLVLMHKPAWQYGHKGFLDLEALLQDRNYTVIAGHEHYFIHEQRLGHDYITMATCGGVWLQDGPGRMDHLLEIQWRSGQPLFINHRYDGEQFQIERL